MTALTSRTRRSSIALAAAALLAITAAAPAVAGGGSTVVKAGHAGGKSVVVNSHGRTLYVLTPETVKHLLCTGSCLSAWLPVKTGKSTKLKAGGGVKGRLGRFSRGGGSYQVTLRGLPALHVHRRLGQRDRGGQRAQELRRHLARAQAGRLSRLSRARRSRGAGLRRSAARRRRWPCSASQAPDSSAAPSRLDDQLLDARRRAAPTSTARCGPPGPAAPRAGARTPRRSRRRSPPGSGSARSACVHPAPPRRPRRSGTAAARSRRPSRRCSRCQAGRCVEVEREDDDRSAGDAPQLRQPRLRRLPVVDRHAGHRRVDGVVVERQRLRAGVDRGRGRRRAAARASSRSARPRAPSGRPARRSRLRRRR